jgi:hypothetical protein
MSARDCGPEEAIVVLPGALRGSAGQLGGLLQSVLDQEIQVIALVEDLAANVWIKRHQSAGLAILLRHELLIKRRDLDVEIEGGEVEVGRESLGRIAVAVPLDVEGRGLVLPTDLIEVEQLCELPFAVVGKLNSVVR